MILAAVPQVDPINDWVDYVSAGAGVVGLVVAIVAIVLANRAQRTADRAVTDERRRMFELEILRDLTKDLDEGLAQRVFDRPATLAEYRFRLSLLSSELSVWTRVMALPDPVDVMDFVGVRELANVEKARRQAEAESERIGADIYILNLQVQNDGRNADARIRLDKARRKDDVLAARASDLKERELELRAAGNAELGKRLAYDVQQEIWARVEARRHAPRRRWWKLWLQA